MDVCRSFAPIAMLCKTSGKIDVPEFVITVLGAYAGVRNRMDDQLVMGYGSEKWGWPPLARGVFTAFGVIRQ